VNTLDQIHLDWSGRETLLVKLLCLRDVALAYALINALTLGGHPVGELDIGAVDWWLEWLTEVRKAGTGGLFGDRMSWVLTEHVSETTRAALLTERFVEHILLPQLSKAKEGLHVHNLRAVLDQAGRRHGRRYFNAESSTEA
jgi:hypothetical protein